MDYEHFAGHHIVRIDSDDPDIKKLSDLGENWELNTKCPNCNRLITFTKKSVNKPIACKRGQDILLRVDNTLL